MDAWDRLLVSLDLSIVGECNVLQNICTIYDQILTVIPKGHTPWETLYLLVYKQGSLQ
jgi:hypothetical protein